MLFSNEDVVAYINSHFEPVWQATRPVPIIRFDFGDGQVVTRTLNGNVATYVCCADGQIIDILPGIYEPITYLSALEKLSTFAGKLKCAGTTFQKQVAQYHRQETSRLRKGLLANMLRSLINGILGRRRANLPNYRNDRKNVAGWKEMREDSNANENIWRLQIHFMLADWSGARPDLVTKRLYKEVLHADLDDPYLGLGPSLFGSHPF